MLRKKIIWRWAPSHLSEEWYDEGQEAPEERHKAVQLKEHAEDGPAQQHCHNTAQEGRGAHQPIPLTEEGQALLQSQATAQAYRVKGKRLKIRC